MGKTIDERAKEYEQKKHCSYAALLGDAYYDGATEQKAIDDKRYEEYLAYMSKQLADSLATQRQHIIDKACEILKNNFGLYQFEIERFRKAMKEE